MTPDRYSPDVLATDWRAPSRGRATPAEATPGLVVEEQKDAIAIVAQTIRDLAASGVPADRALAEGEWPFPREGLTHAVALGYAALPPAARGLPLA